MAGQISTATPHIEDGYIDGYVPVSLHAPHSSLLRSITWIGMGLLLSAIPFLGMFVFGLGIHGNNSQLGTLYAALGLICAVVIVIAGFAAIYIGKKNERAYRARTGRKF